MIFFFSLWFHYVCNPSRFLLRVNEGLRLIGIKQILFKIQSTKNDSCLWADVRILRQSLVFKWYILTYHSLKQVGFQSTKSRNIHKNKHTFFWPRFFFLITTFPQNVSCQNSSTNLRKIKRNLVKTTWFLQVLNWININLVRRLRVPIRDCWDDLVFHFTRLLG